MNKIFLVLTMILFFSFSSENIVEVHAKPCPPGNYSATEDAEAKFTCTKVDSNPGADNENGLKNEDAGPAWVQKFGQFIKAISVVVAYFTQAIAMLTIVYAAYLYTTSEGEERKLRMAKMYIMYAFIGLFIGTFSLVISKVIGGIF